MWDWIILQVKTNQFLSGAIGGSLSYTILNNIKVWFIYIYDLILALFTRQIMVDDVSNKKLTQTFLFNLKKHKRKLRNIQVNRTDKKNTTYFGYGTHWIWYSWFTFIKLTVTRNTGQSNRALGLNAYDSITINIFGLFTDSVRDSLLTSAEDNFGKTDDDSRYYYNVTDYTPSKFTQIKDRPIDSIFINETDALKDIIEKIDRIFNSGNDTIYDKLGHSKKLGILLYGSPGCGKSSIIQAISTYFNKDVYLAHIQDDYNSIEYYLRCVSVGVPEKSIIVYEDFDCIASIKSRDEEKKSDQYDENILPKLLQQFDGLGLPDRTIIIATTNYLDKIDDAAKRDGRFDIKLEITPATKETALKMAEYFGVENKAVLDTLSFPCPQATVQKVLLDTLKNENKL